MAYTSYENLLRDVVNGLGEEVPTGTRLEDGTQPTALSMTGVQFRADLALGFPAVTTKKLQWGSVVKELLWFLRGETNVKTLGCGIWNQWADEDGECGPIYGANWRRWAYAGQVHSRLAGATALFPRTWDQVGELVAGLKAVVENPVDRRRRRLVVSAWNAPEVPRMGLAPCHTLFQVLPVGARLDVCCFWRSIDLFFGMPFNVASYALLSHILCEISGLQPGMLIAQIADAHVYANQVEAVREQIDREPHPEPILGIAAAVRELAPDLTVEQCRLLRPEMFWLENYTHCGPLESRPEIAV
jgi:thymidylate synthase